ncbi:MAG: hypothetical protein JWM82_1302 [Myxococcales bacterium]|nr:hypothetical protein [Myxococcales bacterium]
MAFRCGASRNLTVVGAAAIALQLAEPAVAFASPCEKAVVLEGPGALIETVARRLEANGVSVRAEGTCRSVRVQLSPPQPPGAAGLDLFVEDRFGRTSHRTVSDSGTAASLIESWMARFDADLPVDGSGPPRIDSVTNVSVEAPAPAAAAASDVRLFGGLAGNLGSDQSLRGGGLAGICLRAGPACLGMELYVARDLVDAGAAADLLFTAALPFETNRWLFMPGIGVGPGWTRSRLGAGGRLSALGESTDVVGLRGAISVLAGARLWPRVIVGLDVGTVAAPRASGPTRSAWDGTGSDASGPGVYGRAGLVCMVTP